MKLLFLALAAFVTGEMASETASDAVAGFRRRRPQKRRAMSRSHRNRFMLRNKIRSNRGRRGDRRMFGRQRRRRDFKTKRNLLKRRRAGRRGMKKFQQNNYRNALQGRRRYKKRFGNKNRGIKKGMQFKKGRKGMQQHKRGRDRRMKNRSQYNRGRRIDKGTHFSNENSTSTTNTNNKVNFKNWNKGSSHGRGNRDSFKSANLRDLGSRSQDDVNQGKQNLVNKQSRRMYDEGRDNAYKKKRTDEKRRFAGSNKAVFDAQHRHRSRNSKEADDDNIVADSRKYKDFKERNNQRTFGKSDNSRGSNKYKSN